MKNLLWAIGAVLVAVIISIFMIGHMTAKPSALGGSPVTVFTAVNTGTLTQNGGTTATTSIGAGTLVATDFDDEDLIESTPTGALTISFPASTTFPLDQAPGATREFSLYNVSAAQTITVAGGIGTLLKAASTSKAVPPVSTAVFTAFRKSNSDIVLYMNSGT